MEEIQLTNLNHNCGGNPHNQYLNKRIRNIEYFDTSNFNKYIHLCDIYLGSTSLSGGLFGFEIGSQYSEHYSKLYFNYNVNSNIIDIRKESVFEGFNVDDFNFIITKNEKNVNQVLSLYLRFAINSNIYLYFNVLKDVSSKSQIEIKDLQTIKVLYNLPKSLIDLEVKLSSNKRYSKLTCSSDMIIKEKEIVNIRYDTFNTRVSLGSNWIKENGIYMINARVYIKSNYNIKCKLHLILNDNIIDSFYYEGSNISDINYNYINYFTKGKSINIKIENLGKDIKIISKENNIWKTALDVCRIN